LNEENRVLGSVLSALRSTLPVGRSLVIKHNDSFTQGVPDFSLSVTGYTSWWEAKFSTSFKLEHPRPVQHARLLDLERSGVLARYLVWDRADCVVLVTPSLVKDDWTFDPDKAVIQFYRRGELKKTSVLLLAQAHMDWKTRCR
jgi:hypothetical protein